MNTINSAINSGALSGRIGGDFDGGQGTGSLLSQLGQRVADALDKGRGAEAAKNSVDNQAVMSYINGLSSQPLAGMNHNILV
jgi:hypothetical protein